MMTKILIALAFTVMATSDIATAASNGGRGGGNTIDPKPASVALIQNALSDSALFIRAWLGGVEGQYKPDIGLRGQPRRDQPLPLALEKLFGSPNEVYDRLDQIKIVFKTKAPCEDGDSNHRDGSVISNVTDTICVSGFNLSQKLSKRDYALQTEALIVHELAHLLGADEKEATSIQSQYLDDMASVPKELILSEIKTRSEAFVSLAAVSASAMSAQVNDPEKLCKTLLNARLLMEQASSDVVLPAISLYSVYERDQIDDWNIVVGQAWHDYVCGQNPVSRYPKWVQEYETGFAGKELLPVRTWLKNRGISQVNLNGSSITLVRAHKISELEPQFSNFAGEMRSFAWAVSAQFLIRPTVVIEESEAKP